MLLLSDISLSAEAAHTGKTVQSGGGGAYSNVDKIGAGAIVLLS